jgi:tetratricopeptide (TPR) repeat protein
MTDAVRYVLLETVRAYAIEILAERGHDAAARDAHAEHYTDLADRAGAELTGPGQAGWMTRLEREHENLRAAFEHHLAGERGGPAAARLAVGLWRFWRNAGRLREGRQSLDRLLDERVALPDAARARVLHAAAVLAAAQDDHAAARDFAGESLARARAAGEARTVAQAGNALGIAEMTAGRHAAAREHFNDSLAVWQELADPVGWRWRTATSPWSRCASPTSRWPASTPRSACGWSASRATPAASCWACCASARSNSAAATCPPRRYTWTRPAR